MESKDNARSLNPYITVTRGEDSLEADTDRVVFSDFRPVVLPANAPEPVPVLVEDEDEDIPVPAPKDESVPASAVLSGTTTTDAQSPEQVAEPKSTKIPAQPPVPQATGPVKDAAKSSPPS